MVAYMCVYIYIYLFLYEGMIMIMIIVVMSANMGESVYASHRCIKTLAVIERDR